MPRFLGGSSARAPLTDPTDYPSLNEIDLNEIGNNGTTYYTDNVWLSDYNSFNRPLDASQTVYGTPDHISGWDSAEIRVTNGDLLSSLVYELSLDGGKTYPFSVPISLFGSFGTFPLMGQFGRLMFKTGTTWVNGTKIQIALFYRRSAMGNSSAALLGATSHPNDLIPANTTALNVKVVNDWEDDYITGKVGSRRTGACAGYSNDIGATFQSVTNIASGTLPYPGVAGVANVKIASSSIQDSSTGTGISMYIFQFMQIDYSLVIEFVSLSGTTPVSISTTPIYRFVIGFPITAGSGYDYLTTVSVNKGVIYLGTGAFSTTTGFAVNYMVNRIDDGVIVTPTYTVPKGTRGLLYELKYAAEASKPVLFRTYGRGKGTDPWSLQIEDIVTTTIQPRRSLIGGWLAPGGEWTVVARRSSGTNVIANFIMTIIEVQESIFNTYVP